ncbi:MAG: LysR family transcriptional regulator [Actinomycetota bacterium]
MLTFHQLDVFIAVADHMSVRRAAEELVVSQPAVSSSLAALQREVGVALVARDGRGIELTDAGRTMLAYARRLRGLVDETLDAVRSVDGDTARPIRLGATSTVASHVLTPMLADLRDLRPELDFTLRVEKLADLWRLLDQRDIDLAFGTRPPVTSAFTSVATRPAEFVLVARPGVVWAGRLGEATWLLREEGSTTRMVVEEVMARLDLSPRYLEIGSDEAVLRSAEAGLGLALLPLDDVAGALRSRTLVTVHTTATPVSRPWHAVVRADEPPTKPVQAFIDDLTSLDDSFRPSEVARPH